MGYCSHRFGLRPLPPPGQVHPWQITPVIRDMQLPKSEPLQHPPLPLDTSVSLEVGGGEVSQLLFSPSPV